MDSDDKQISQIAAEVRSGCIIAAAGCGKTEQIARATALCPGCRLILTHTHAGVDALRARLKKHGVPANKYHIDTIAGWSLRFAASFPMRSGLTLARPSDDEWNAVYECALRLIRSRAVLNVLMASYSGVFVDEYQDCTYGQHQIISALATDLPTCVFGDPMQAIFDFKGQKSVDWDTDVFPQFPKSGQLLTPWRWKNAGNGGLAEWLENARQRLEQRQPIDLDGRCASVKWAQLPPAAKSQAAITQRQLVTVGTCKSIAVDDGEKLIIIGDSANLKARANLGQKLAKFGFANMEPVGCKDLFGHADQIESSKGMSRLEAVLTFAAACLTGSGKSELLKAVKSHIAGGRRGAGIFPDLIPECLEIVASDPYHHVIELLDAMRRRQETRLYRPGMFFPLRSALHLMATGEHRSLADAVWDIQNRLRHAGRRLGKKSIGSTLLVKGLEFDHAVIIDADSLSRKNLYVALTRPIRSLTILSHSRQITSQS